MTRYYKYGGSDATRHQLGAMPALFWHVIQATRIAGATTFDLGRSDLDQPGLIAFKNHLGARQSVLTYYQYPARTSRFSSKLPDVALDFAGRLLYRHLG